MQAGLYLDEMLALPVERQLRARASAGGVAGFRVVQASAVRPGANDPAQLAYAADHDLVLVTRNVQDFLRLNELWTVLREWGLSRRAHPGILIPLGPIRDLDWADCIMDLLLHPNCPTLTDQLLLWRTATGRWECEQPYARRRRRVVRL